MNTNMNGKAISQIWWINDHGDSCVRAGDGRTLALSATHNGDRDECWVIERKNGVEVARHNCRHIATITWAAGREAEASAHDAIVMHAVSAMLDYCANSYSNAYTQKWLTKAKELGVYHGPVIGRIDDIKAEWHDWLDEKGGLPDLLA